MKLIDADKLSADMYHEAFAKDSDMQKWDNGCWIRYKMFEDVLKAQPAVQPNTTTNDSIPAETGKNDGDKTSGDCISRTQAIDALRGYLVEKRCPDDGTLICRLIENEVINKLPSAQPDIIHCKDCAYCDSDVVDAPYGMTKKVWWCNRLYAGANENLIVEPDDFCSWAERRDDE